MKNSPAAFAWIVEQLTKRQVKFAVIGGLAANAYGSSRALNDIDIDIPTAEIARLAIELKEYLVFGPERSVSECFDCQLVGFCYQEQEIELSGAESIYIKDLSDNSWKHWPTDLSKIEMRNILGIDAPVMAREALIAYKKIAARETDLIDVEFLQRTFDPKNK